MTKQDANPLDEQWRLSRIEVFNWGTFGDGHVHSVEVPRGGLVVTGRSGSGKSSLLDAVSTVLVAPGQVRYNAAAQDISGRSTDRSLVSYVRGAWKRAESDGDEIATEFLRTGATWSAILLRFDTAMGTPPVLLAKLFHIARGKTTNADVRDAALLLRVDARIEDFEPFVKAGLDLKNLRREFGKGAVFDRHSSFQDRYRRQLGLDKEAAVGLLHRTMAAKNFQSLDGLFREFMLDKPDTFELSDRAVEQFDELSQAHNSVVEAGRQLASLDALHEASERWEVADQRAAEIDELTAALEPTALRLKVELSETRLRELAQEITNQKAQLESSTHSQATAQGSYDTAYALVQGLGGDRLGLVADQLRDLERRREEVAENRIRFARSAKRVGIDSLPSSLAEFEEFRATLADTEKLQAEVAKRREITYERHNEYARLRKEQEGIDRELKAAQSSRSNIDSRRLAARDRIAQLTNLEAADLPFSGELLEVDPEFLEWTGAIERLLRPLALTMLVEAKHVAAVTDAIDAHHWGTRLVVQSVAPDNKSPKSIKGDRSLVHRVNIKADARFENWLSRSLHDSYDFACVESAKQLREVDRGITIRGQIRRHGGRFEKDDSYRIDDRSRWLLGFTAEDKINRLLDELGEVNRQLQKAESLRTEADQLQDRATETEHFANEAQHIPWSSINTSAVDADIIQKQAELEKLSAGSPELSAAHSELKQRALVLQHAREALDESRVALSLAEEEHATLSATYEHLHQEAQSTDEPDKLLRDQLRKQIFADRRRLTVDEVDGRAGKVRAQLNTALREADRERGQAETAFAEHATRFLGEWRHVIPDAAPKVEDRALFDRRRREIIADDLPTFKERFLDLLRTQSMQNIGALNWSIQQAPAEVRRRIDPVTESLSHSEFDAGRWLKIDVQASQSADVREFMRDLSEIASDYGKEIDEATADRKFEIMRRVIGRLGSSENRRWRDAVLDTRRHVTFRAREVDATGETMDIYSSSEGLSGGQRQKLVTFCLAAALRYQLTQGSDDVPSFGTVILDEAFDRADEAFTRMALEVFLDFGFHMVLATPMKMLRTLELYVEGVALVESEERRRSRIRSIIWEEGKTMETVETLLEAEV